MRIIYGFTAIFLGCIGMTLIVMNPQQWINFVFLTISVALYAGRFQHINR
ncbi:hypothetical protein [Rossellomorea aquimaris]|nr:hypothetical protein [Rossellomorea aquimaris]